MQDYKFSILIANYNNGKFFKDCYDSILSQTYENWEAIILDDASTDNSVELIKNIIGADKRFKLFTNEKNSGVGLTKGKLIDLAEGEICGFLDPDDALFINALEDSINELKKNTEIIATYSQLTFCNNHLIPEKNFTKIKQVYNNKYFFNCPIQLSAFFAFRRNIYLKTEGINPHLKSAVDQDLYLKLFEHGSPKFLNKEMYKYRLHNGGISQYASKNSAKENFAKVILSAMHRRNLKKINGKKVPEAYNNANEIFDLLEYQNSIYYRILNKFRVLFQNI